MQIQTHPKPSCPDCGAQMILRRPPKKVTSWRPFWGCSRYPECRGTLNIGSDGKPVTDTGPFKLGDFD